MTDRCPADEPPAQPSKTPERLWRELLGEQLRSARHGRGETLHGVAHRAKVSPQYLSEVERGRKEASSEIIAALGDALGLTLLDLTTGVASRLGASSASASRGGFRLAA